MGPNHFPRISLAIVIAFVLSLSAFGQYFGQNRVRYKALDFKVLKTEHFDIYYYDEEQAAMADMARMAERWYARLSKFFNHQLSSRQPLILYATPSDFRGTTVIPGDIGEGTGGVTEALRRRVIMPLAGPVAETDHVLGHELIHAFQYDIGSRPGPQIGGQGAGLERLPLWFIEGMAEYVSLGPVDANTAMWMRDAVADGKLPKIKDLDDPKYFPYRWGQAFWAYVAGRHGDETVARMLRFGTRSGNIENTIRAALQTSEEELTREWHAALNNEYRPVLRITTPIAEQGRPVAAKRDELNVSPVLSPDGKTMVFFSSRDLFSIDLFLADAATGKVRRKLTDTATDPHVDSLTFLNSAGAWSQDGTRFAYGAVVKGKPQLTIYDVERDTDREIPLAGIGEIYNPTWSPDGKQIAFAALVGGLTDLYVVELEGGALRRLTNDAFADLQPAWSPDGRRIAFVTDRFGGDAAALDFGPYRLALIAATGGNIEPVRAFDTGKHTNPQWSDNGRSLLFVSDRDGIPNVYRLSMADGRIAQVTNIQTGVAGITPLSPAFSVDAKGERLVFSVFLKGDHGIYALDSAEEIVGAPPDNRLAALQPATLPPHERTSRTVVAMLNTPEAGLPAQRRFSTTNYKPRLGLEYIAPPNVAVGTSSFGTIAAGGTALYFSDLLNQHTLMFGTQIGTSGAGHFFRNFTGLVGYQNQKSRWNWGFIGGQIPFLTGSFAQGVTNVDGMPALVEHDILLWQIERDFQGTASYPFSRAQRVEFSAGYRNISYAASADTRAFSLVTGNLIAEESEDLPTPGALNLGTASAALVYDTSIFGGTSPVVGQRYRLEGGGFGGTLNFASLLADYRRYFKIARPLSLAGRLLHYGRYGGASEDSRLQDLFLGYPTLVRGYDPGSFTAEECGSSDACPVFDRLLGSRMAVGNAELRLALLGPLGIIPSRRVPPVEASFFYDVGYSWRSFDDLTPRRAVSSYGPALRFNILGFAIGQLSYAIPIDRPQKDHVWQFTLTPGF